MPKKEMKIENHNAAETAVDMTPKLPVYPSIDPVRAAIANYFFPYQKKVLNSKARCRTLEFSRQIGKSETISCDSPLNSIERNVEQKMMSGSQDLTNELMIKVQKWCKVFNVLIHDIEPETFEYEGMKLIQRTAKLPGGRRITCVPANPSTAVGRSGDLYWDEAAKHKNEREIWRAAAPMITRGDFRLTLSSTHETTKTVFYEQCQSDEFEHHKCDIYEAVNKDILPIRNA
jgi:phage FluMu gp28-like protein